MSLRAPGAMINCSTGIVTHLPTATGVGMTPVSGSGMRRLKAAPTVVLYASDEKNRKAIGLSE